MRRTAVGSALLGLLALLGGALVSGCDSAATSRVESAATGSHSAPAVSASSTAASPSPVSAPAQKSASAKSAANDDGQPADRPQELYLPDAAPAAADPSASAVAAKPAAPPRIAAIGDSLTDYRSHGGGYLRYIERHCPGARVDNFAKGGAMVNQMRRRFRNTVLRAPAGTYTHLIVFGGVNDLYSDLTAGRTVDKISGDLEHMYQSARELDIAVVAINVAPWGGFKRWYNERRGAATMRLNAWIAQQQAAGMVDHLIDAYELLSCDDSPSLCPSFERRIADGLHFNSAAHEQLGEALIEGPFADCLKLTP